MPHNMYLCNGDSIEEKYALTAEEAQGITMRFLKAHPRKGKVYTEYVSDNGVPPSNGPFVNYIRMRKGGTQLTKTEILTEWPKPIKVLKLIGAM